MIFYSILGSSFFKIRLFYDHSLAKRTSKIPEDKGYVLQGNQHDREMKRIVAKFNDKEIFDGKFNYCETFKLTFDNDKLINIEIYKRGLCQYVDRHK